MNCVLEGSPRPTARSDPNKVGRGTPNPQLSRLPPKQRRTVRRDRLRLMLPAPARLLVRLANDRVAAT